MLAALLPCAAVPAWGAGRQAAASAAAAQPRSTRLATPPRGAGDGATGAAASSRSSHASQYTLRPDSDTGSSFGLKPKFGLMPRDDDQR